MSLVSEISALATAVGAAIKAHTTGFHGGEAGRGIVAISGSPANSTTTLADVTGLSFPVVAGARYAFKFVIPFSTSNAASAATFGLNGPPLTQLNSRVLVPLSATAVTARHSAAYGAPAATGASAATTGNVATIEGVIQTSAAGNVIARFASENTGTITVLPGAHVEWIKFT